jgi:hypothetical protein
MPEVTRSIGKHSTNMTVITIGTLELCTTTHFVTPGFALRASYSPNPAVKKGPGPFLWRLESPVSLRILPNGATISSEDTASVGFLLKCELQLLSQH